MRTTGTGSPHPAAFGNTPHANEPDRTTYQKAKAAFRNFGSDSVAAGKEFATGSLLLSGSAFEGLANACERGADKTIAKHPKTAHAFTKVAHAMTKAGEGAKRTAEKVKSPPARE